MAALTLFGHGVSRETERESCRTLRSAILRYLPTRLGLLGTVPSDGPQSDRDRRAVTPLLMAEVGGSRTRVSGHSRVLLQEDSFMFPPWLALGRDRRLRLLGYHLTEGAES